jgi:hypothetical protein
MRLFEFSPPTLSAATSSQPKAAPQAIATEAPGSNAQAGALKGSSSAAVSPQQEQQQQYNQLKAGKTINHPKFGPVRIKMDQGNKVVLDTAAKFGQDVTVDKDELMKMLSQQQGQ